MNLQYLVQQRHNIQCDILECLQDEVASLKVLAEDMIERATDIKGQGYSMFIRSRSDFMEKIDELQKQLEQIGIINTCTHH